MFYVIDTAENMTSWSAKKEAAESFGSRKAAEKRAKELADMEPGKLFAIVQTIATVSCAVAPPVVKNSK